MKIKITDDHIKNGIKQSVIKCALALAVSEVIDVPCMVGLDIIWIGYKYMRLPKEAMQFVKDFDLGLAKPCELEIPLKNEN